MHGSILDAIGTPLVQVDSPEGATVAAKIEAFNPGGSAKDRPALSMIEAAEREGRLSPGDSIVEPTSGNTGIGLAIACAARGYDLTIVMPASMSEERRRLLRAYGAEIELVEGTMEAARERADRIVEETGAIQLGQFENAANADAHYRTTAPEILESVGDRAIDALVVGVGTGGTLTGTATRLAEEFPDMETVAVEPEGNAVLSTGEPGEDEFQGMGPGFVSDLLDVDLLNSIETVDLDAAEHECRRLARQEGVLVGQSSGAASVAARRVAGRLAQPDLDCPEASDMAGLTADGGLESGHDDCPLVVTIFPDSGERYLSTGLFD